MESAFGKVESKKDGKRGQVRRELGGVDCTRFDSWLVAVVISRSVITRVGSQEEREERGEEGRE